MTPLIFKPNILQLGGWICLLFILWGCNGSDASLEKPNEPAKDHRIFVSNEQFQQNEMTLISPKAMDFPQTITANGTVSVPPQSKAVVTAIMGGYVKEIPFLKGDKVRKGQPLLYIENQEFVQLQQQYLEVKQQIEYLKSEYERQKILADEMIASQKNFLKARSDYQSAQAQMSGLKKQLQLINIMPERLHFGNISSVVPIYSPIDGNVSEILVEQGGFVSATSPLVRVIDNRHLHLILTVFEKDALLLRQGQKVLFTLPEVSDQTFSAKVILISSDIDQKRTVQVNAHIDDEKNTNFISGMYVSAQIITKTQTALGLPETAVAETENGLFALQLNEKTDKGYYFHKVRLNDTRPFAGYVRTHHQKDTQFLNGKVFELIE